jgi:hypothetical protein
VAKTWCDLFGALLPNTAAGPQARIAYLERVSASSNSSARKLVVNAAERMLRGHESSFSSVGLQGGAAAEPRGLPQTSEQAWDYWRGGLTLLRKLVDDPETDIAASALSALVQAIHPYLEIEPVRSHLVGLLQTLPQPALTRVRAELMRLEAILQRATDADARRAALEALTAELPPLSTKYEELLALLPCRTWDFGVQGELLRKMTDVVGAAIAEVGLSLVLDLLRTDMQAPFEFGHAIGELAASDEALTKIASLAGPNVPALVGYLTSVRAAGADSIFDDFLDGDNGTELDPEVRLQLTVNGPTSEAGWLRATDLASALPVGTAARVLVGWHTYVDSDRTAGFLRDWLGRIYSQHDYNMAILFTALAVNSQRPWVDGLDELIVDLVGLRRQFPNTYQESWDWSQLAKRQLEHQPLELVKQMVAIMIEGGVYIYGMGDEQTILEEAVTEAGMPAWEFIMSMLAGGAWLLENDVRGWLPRTQLVSALTAWVGDDLARARLAASVIDVGDGDAEPSPLVIHLREHFGGDGQVSSAVGI